MGTAATIHTGQPTPTGRTCARAGHTAGASCSYRASGDGTQLHVVEAGDPGARRGVVFVHGFAQSHLAFEEQLAGAAKWPEWRLLSFDLRGHGWSHGGPGDYRSAAAWADDLKAVIAGADLDEVVVVAWSYGGFVVGDFLGHGGTVAGLVLVSAGSRMVPVPEDASGGEFVELIPALRADGLERRSAADRRMLELLTHRPLGYERALRFAGASARAEPAARREMFSRRHDVTSALTQSGAPTLVVHGEHDALNPLDASRALAERAGAPLVVIPSTGHMPFLEGPDAFDDALSAFLESLPTTPAATGALTPQPDERSR